eukprot:CAMPEP_0185266098 /NCGR_PEP_ID=MMETSP1359-20130426/29926_1 /TAXON_ID=552665 /ORGANISM="Bigelowiella longifila, Strain CCMP242" /LENGTH=218 /DNA_ID=CAMNT_0027855745 /DNA_START=21 /DNA_END=677 /DNA_ORIENTATION=-
MKAMKMCRPLERTRGAVVSECVENILKAPSVAWKARVKEIVQAARQDERQKMMKRFVQERKTWNSTCNTDKNTIHCLQNEIKSKDRRISWLQSSLNERENYIALLKKNVAELEKHLETEMNSRLRNAEGMKQLVGPHNAMYPGLLRFGEREGSDPFHEVAADLLRQHKINLHADILDDKTSTSSVTEEAAASECSDVEMECQSSRQSMEDTMKSFLRA